MAEGAAGGSGGRGRYDGLTRSELVRMLELRDKSRRLGLVWERNEIEADRALEGDFVAAAPVPELAEGAAPWRNLVIEADNYDALRWLRMTWAGRIKCVYVDPPYNTGNRDWVYNDHYVDKDDRWRHSTWLEFLYRRFTLARDLLTEDGVILVSINDENRAKLELMLDQALPGMRIGSLVWRTRTGGNEGGDHFLSDNHEHVLVYGNSGFRFGGTQKTYEMYANPDNDPRGDWRGDNLTKAATRVERPNAYYPLHDSQQDIYYPCNPDQVWRFSSRRLSPKVKTRFMEDWIADGQVMFPTVQRVSVFETRAELDKAIEEGNVPKSGRSPLLRADLPDLDFWVGKRIGFGTPRFKRFKKDLRSENQPLSSWITPTSERQTADPDENAIVAGTNDEGAKAIKAIFGEKAFNYPKPPSLIRGLIAQATGPDDTVLDFFAGSGTTAQAVMSLNAEDGGSRRFVLVSSTEATRDAPDRNLCRDVTANRVRRLNASTDPAFADLSAEFAYLRCRKVKFEDADYELSGEEIWAALESLHQLPLTPYELRPWLAHETDAMALVYVDEVADDLFPWLAERGARRLPLFVYAWAPGQVREAFGSARPDIELRDVRATLVARFRT